jgi:hypothetical protein
MQNGAARPLLGDVATVTQATATAIRRATSSG